MKYRKKPIVIDAVQFTGDNAEEMGDFCKNAFRMRNQFAPWMEFSAEVYDYVHKSWIKIKPGQFVIRGSKGEFYPHDEELFYQHYETEDGSDIQHEH